MLCRQAIGRPNDACLEPQRASSGDGVRAASGAIRSGTRQRAPSAAIRDESSYERAVVAGGARACRHAVFAALRRPHTAVHGGCSGA